ncbi:YfjI family protein [Endozoicomonas sp. ALC020]|uniref:YfjI family protein n=1 Tax=unclassified Endozoicomonas TaxID=2644528 RepID=UPI003BB10E64
MNLVTGCTIVLNEVSGVIRPLHYSMALCDQTHPNIKVVRPEAIQEEIRQSGLDSGSRPAIDWPELLPVQEITPDMLPPELSGWLMDTVERMDNAPFEYAAVAAVTALGSLIGRKVSVKPKQYDDWAIIPNLWGCCIGRPSQKKTPVIKDTTKPLTRLEAEARAEHKEDLKRYQAQEKINQMATREAERQAQALVKKKDLQAAEALLMDDSSDPEKPASRRYIVNDATVEKLGILLSENPWGLLLFRDELAGWIAGLNRDDQQQDRAFWLEAFNGDGTYSYDRVTRDDVYITSNTVSLLGGIQPGRLLPLLMTQRDGSGDDGLVERFQLLVYPDKRSFRLTDRSPDKALKEQAYQVFRRLDNIPYQPEEEDRPAIRFDDQAQAVFNRWYSDLMTRISGEGVSLQMESHLGKYPSLMPALALVFHVISNGATGRISKASVEMAIRWCDVLETHARRVYALADDPLAGARILADRIGQLPQPFKMADLERRRWIGLQEKRDREQAVKWLELHGYIVREESKGRGRPSVTFHINPACLVEEEKNEK